jgi:TolB-like protein/lipoprotein NlpI
LSRNERPAAGPVAATPFDMLTPVPATRSSASSFFEQLKRRKVVRMAVAYAVVAWLLLQLADVLVPALNLPGWTIRLVTLLLILGFPVALIASWFVEPANTGSAPEEESAPSATAPVVPAAAPATSMPSIAVLPFADLSQTRDQEHFTDGLAEELLNLLSGVTGLRVIARTSSFAFKARAATIAQIARELDVNHVLEGSVRSAGERLRITAQLVRAADSSHVWSQTYDRNLTDIFAVQDDIAAAVTRELCDRLLPARTSPVAVGHEPTATAMTRDSEAYDQYLRGRFHANRRTGEGYVQAIACLRRAVALDSGFAPAWAALGWACLLQADQGYTDAKRGFADGRAAVQRGLELDPELVEAHTALAWIAIAHDWDWNAARLAIDRALAAEPSNAHALMVQGVLEYTLARHDAAQRSLEASLTRDPLRPITYQFIGRNFTNSGRFAEAEAAFRRELELDPGREAVHYFIARSLLYAGRVDEALREAALEKDPVWALLGRSLCLHTSGDDAGSRRALDELSARFADVSAYQVAEAYGWRGDVDDAFKWLDIAFDQRDSGLGDIVGAPTVRSLLGDPRYATLMQRLKLPLKPESR